MFFEINQNDVVDEILENPQVDPTAIQKFLEELPDKLLRFGVKVLIAALVFIIGMQLIKLVRRIVHSSMERHNTDVGVRQFADSFLKYALYILLIFLVASGFGINVASMVALLGSAGVTIGLALQGSLSNLAGGVLILLLKPFRVGDYIIESSGKNEGTVKAIQIFYTTLETMDKNIVMVPNGSLSGSSVTNYSCNPKRRMLATVGISYSSDIRLAKEVIQKVLAEESRVLQDEPKQVFVDELGDSAVVLGVRCSFRNEDYWEGKWAVTEKIKLALDEAGVQIPFPQLDVHFDKQN
mgnify:FL=1